VTAERLSHFFGNRKKKDVSSLAKLGSLFVWMLGVLPLIFCTCVQNIRVHCALKVFGFSADKKLKVVTDGPCG
jgi:hypothetical protein